MIRIPEEAVPVVLTPPVTTNGGVTADYISLKLAHMVYLVAVFTQAVGHATGMDPVQATAVDGTGAKAITNTVPIWANADISLTSKLTRQTDAITYNINVAAKNQIVIMQIDPASFDVANGFDVLGVTVDDSSQATDLVSLTAFVVPRYKDSNYIVD
jgi:hypothetical protein